MLKDADVVILDEASAFADPECEMQVQKAFQEMARGRTVIMIAHRLSTIRNADRIYVLQDGKVKEEGKHEALLEENGLPGFEQRPMSDPETLKAFIDYGAVHFPAEKYDLLVTAGSDYHGSNKLVLLGDKGCENASEGPPGMLRFLDEIAQKT